MRKLKELFSDTLIYGISSVFARFINYLLVPLYTGIFNPDAYGIVGLVYAAIALLNVLFTVGMESSYLRYAKDRENAKSYFKTIQVFLLGTSLVFALLIWLMGPFIIPQLGLETGDPIFLMMLGILVFDTLSVVPFAELRLIRKPILFAVLKTGNVIINLSLNVYLILVLEFGIEAVFISNLVASVITALVIWIVTAPMLLGQIKREFLNKILMFGLPFIPAGIGHVINELLDRFFLKGMSSESILAIYGVEFPPEYIVGVYNACYKLAVFMLLLLQMFRMAWQPFFMRQSDTEDAPALFAQTFSLFNIAAAIMVLLVALFLEQIVSIKIPILNEYLIGKQYWMGLSIVPVLLIAYWFQGWYVNFSAGIYIAEQTKILAKITLIGALVTIATNLILVSKYGMMGSAVATLCSYGTMALLIYRSSVRVFKVPYKLWQGFAVVGITAMAIFGKSALSGLFFSNLATSFLMFLVAITAIVALSFREILFSKKSGNSD